MKAGFIGISGEIGIANQFENTEVAAGKGLRAEQK